MNRRTLISIGLFAGLGLLAAAVIAIAMRPKAGERSAEPLYEATRLTAEFIRLRMDGQDSAARRRELKAAAKRLGPTTLSRAIAAFADGRLEEAAREPAEHPFAGGLKGWILVELGRKAEGAGLLRDALKDAQPDWEFRPLFRDALAKAE